MRTSSLHSPDPAAARKKIDQAKSNARFVAALLDRDHRGHKEAVRQWSRLHEAAYSESELAAAARIDRRNGDAPWNSHGTGRDDSKRADTVRHVSRRRGMATRFKSRLQDIDGSAGDQTAEPEPGGRPVINKASDRIQAILNNAPALFEIHDNPDANRNYADSYADHDAGATAVATHNATIEREAARQGVDADLVKAIMYVENAQGRGYGFAETFGLASTILPMNINDDLWSGLGAEPEQFFDPKINVRMGVTLLRRIRDRIGDPTPGKIAAIWNFAGHEMVSDYGARVQDVYERRLWLRPLRDDLQGGMTDLEFGVP